MNIYVANIPFKATEAELKGLFEEYGEVSSAKIILDKFFCDAIVTLGSALEKTTGRGSKCDSLSWGGKRGWFALPSCQEGLWRRRPKTRIKATRSEAGVYDSNEAKRKGNFG